MGHELQSTSVKIFADKYKDFRVVSIQEDISLQCLVNRSIYLFLTDPEYKKIIKQCSNLVVSGSSF